MTRADANDDEVSGWAIGAAAFAAFMMLMLGCWLLIAGIAALARDGFSVATENYLFQFDTTT
ncbi:MAG: hypothetical protein H7311_04345 [Ramlibacter sp.]|nr:hypothetical protein [Cryobacterium sp.]